MSEKLGSVANAVVFMTSDSDGIETRDFCNGETHFRRSRESYASDEPEDISVFGKCDGSCKPERRTHDLRKLVQKVDKDLQQVVEVDQATSWLLASKQSIVGVHFRSMYCKRNSRSDDYCLGTFHIHWSESFDWHLKPRSKIHATHTLSISLCDGSCCKTTVLSRREKRSLRKQEHDRKIWEAEWAARYVKSA